ncbi:MAG TPA: hypothetical protein VKZ82_28585 [Nonomuraea sp.]|nr:hypothetical protein [Nonomuraea sp.]
MNGHRSVRLPRGARPERLRPVPAWQAWGAGTLVFLDGDRSELFTVAGHEGSRVVVESLDTGDRETVTADRLTAAAGGDDAVLRHAWPVGVEVHYCGGLYEVVGHEAKPGLWFGRLRLRPVGGGPEIRTTTDVVVPRTQTPAWMRGG